MPTYQYRCQDCSRDLEMFQKFTDASLTVCPECQGSLRKVFNAVGVVFKGSGFYKTDSRTSSSSSGSTNSTQDGSSSSASSSKNGSDSATPAASTSTSSPSSVAAS